MLVEFVIHEAMHGCKKSKDSLKACFENVNIMNFIKHARIQRGPTLTTFFLLFG